MSKEDFSIYWPGTDVVKSRNNGFCVDHDGPHIDWAKEMLTAGAGTKITADVERRRAAGRDPGTFYGISHKADDMIRAHGGAYSRARSRTGPKADTKASRLRKHLASGPKGTSELGALMGEKPKSVRALLAYDVDNGKIVTLRDQKPFRYALAAAA